jgi:proteasome lid subunit RPN8/RPN11
VTSGELVRSSFGEVWLSSEGEQEIRRHATSTYPEEACGMLVGELDPPPGTEGPIVRSVASVRPVPNRKTEERTHRFLIPADELRRAERELQGTGRGVVGFYHSHPDHPAQPSAFDRDHAWPWYAYLVLGVEQGLPGELNAFELDPEDRVFQPRRLRVGPVTWVTGPTRPATGAAGPRKETGA